MQIAKIYKQHADEFTDSMTAVVTLPTPGGPQETRIFSLRGCHLLAMFARTPVAKAFRVWVLDVLETLNKAEQARPALESPSGPITPDQQCTLQNMVKALVDRGGIYANIWSRFNNHFRLGSYKQLPQSLMGDAICNLMQLEVSPAQKALPEPEAPALPPDRVPAEDERERQLGRMHEAINTMRDAEGKIYNLSRTLRAPVMRDLDARRAIAIQMHYADEEMFYMMDRAVNSIRHHVTALAMSGRM